MAFFAMRGIGRSYIRYPIYYDETIDESSMNDPRFMLFAVCTIHADLKNGKISAEEVYERRKSLLMTALTYPS